MLRLADKVILITGAVGAVGAAVAEAIRRDGGVAISSDVSQAADVSLDVISEDAWRAAFAEVERKHGRLDGLVNAAGIAMRASVEDLDFADWRRVLAVNLDGAFLGCKYALPLLRRNGGSIVNISSVYGIVGHASLPAYAASKGGLQLLTKSVALHGARFTPKVRCNAVCPAFLEGPMVDAAIGDTPYPEIARRGLTTEIPLGRLGQAAEVAELCAYLLSDDASFVTGSAMTIDGGLTAR